MGRAVPLGVGLVVLAVYAASHAASLSGLFPPDTPPPRELAEARLLEYLTRESGIAMSWWLSSIAGAVTAALAYHAGRRLGASSAASAAACLALAFGRGFWQQAVLPGIDALLPLAAAMACLAAVESRRRSSRVWTVAAIAGVIAATGWPRWPDQGDPGAAARWTFIELTAAGLALAAAGLAAAARERHPLAGVVAGTLALTAVRGASSGHAALLPVFTVLCPLTAAGASRLASWLAPRRPVWLLLLPLVPLLGNARHVVSDDDREPRRRLDAFARRLRACDVVIGQANASTPPGEPRAPRPGCELFALDEARAALEHTGHRFGTISIGDPLPAAGFDLSRATGSASCITLAASAWTDISGLVDAGRIGVALEGPAPSGGVVVYAGRDRPLDPWLPISWTVIAPGLDHRPLPTGGSRAAALRSDGVDLAAAAAVPSLHRIAISGGTSTNRSMLASLDFGGVPSVAVARPSGSRRVSVCAAPRGRNLFDLAEVRREVLRGGRSFFGAGWGPIERRDGQDWRPLAAAEAELLLPLAGPAEIDVTIAAASDTTGEVAVTVNGAPTEARRLETGTHDYTWRIANGWKPGVNQLLIRANTGVRISQITLSKIGN